MLRRTLGIGLVTLALTLAVPFVLRLIAWSPPAESAGRPYTGLVDRYLATREVPSGLLGHGSRWFCATRFLGAETAGRRVDVDVWALCEETQVTGRRVAIGTAESVPVVVHLRRTGSGLRAVGYEEPGDSPDYAPDVHRLFPGGMAGWIIGNGDRGGIGSLDAAVHRQARAAAGRG
jgi:hypothetical protein